MHNANSERLSERLSTQYIYIFHLFVYMYIYIYTYTNMYICLYVYICMYVQISSDFNRRALVYFPYKFVSYRLCGQHSSVGLQIEFE